MNDIEFIEKAFAKRERPQAVRDMSRPADEIYSDADAFAGKDWREVTCVLLEKHYNATSGLSPEAFCYYLPGIYVAGMREGRPDLLVNDTLIIGLDRGNAPASWDDFFRERWPRLTPQECEATQRWILWLSEFDPPPIEDASLSRAYDTMDLLAHQTRPPPPLCVGSNEKTGRNECSTHSPPLRYDSLYVKCPFLRPLRLPNHFTRHVHCRGPNHPLTIAPK
jgi:hypothetical protein